MAERKKAKLFQNGGSQAVRLPAEFRFDADEVYVFRDEATGNVVLSAVPRRRSFADFLAYRGDAPVTPAEWRRYESAVAHIRMTRDEIRFDTLMETLLETDE